MPMMLEPWPGGRWFRDLGDGNGHLWGHVQAIKRPTLLEITGPLMMSFAVASNLQYRLKEIDGGTLITLRHTALGLFPDGYREALSQGWPLLFDRVRRRVERRNATLHEAEGRTDGLERRRDMNAAVEIRPVGTLSVQAQAAVGRSADRRLNRPVLDI